MLLDFGLSCNALYPDLLAEQLRKAVGSPAWISPNKSSACGVTRAATFLQLASCSTSWSPGDYPLAHRRPTAACASACGLTPPRRAACSLSCQSGCRKSSCAAWSPKRPTVIPRLRTWLLNTAPEQITVTERGRNIIGTGFRTHFKRWLKATGMHYQPSPLPTRPNPKKSPS